MERHRLIRIGVAALATLVVASGVRWWAGGRGLEPPSRVRVMVPDGERIVVEVLNATRTRGLARRATFALRDAGFDVVSFGNGDEVRDSTLVLDRSGRSDYARRVAEALGGARVEVRPDASRYLDVTVLVGSDWRPPAKPFNP